MRPCFLTAITLLLLLPNRGLAQADGCRGALNALNRVKEQITPRLNPSTPAGNSRLTVMQSTLERGASNCREFPELWFYLAVVSQKLGRDKDAKYARDKLAQFEEEGRWDSKSEFDPFAMPVIPPSRQSGREMAATAPGHKWALVVGIDEFEDPRASKLDSAVKDATDFAAFLKDPDGGRFDPKHVFYLANHDATIKGLREGLGKIRLHAKPDDLVVVYIASHGSAREMDPNGVSYILAQDTDLDNPATLYSSSLQMIDLVQLANRDFQARSVVLILDTCFSGDAIGSPTQGGENAQFSLAFDNLKLGHGRAVLTASRSNERSWEIHGGAKDSNGYFTRCLLDVLKETGGQASLQHIFSEVSTRVTTRVHDELHASQNPTFEFSDEATGIVLGLPETATQ